MDQIEELLTRGVDTIYPSKKELEKVLRSGKKLRLYQGFDPTGTQLHIGHMIGLRKLRQFQDLGHHVIFVIGDGTGQAGDPSGKLTSRDKFFDQEELRKNATDYVKQAKKIVRFEGENPVEILFNGDWLTKLTFKQMLELFGHFSLQQLSERDLFERRMKEGQEINFREFVYPLLQGYDSVAMNVDLEIGGTDQTFNMLTGRKLVKEMLGKDKFVLTLPLLADSSGRKIGKTEGNVIALTAPPKDFFGMIMSLPDDVIVPCFELLTDTPMTQVSDMKKALEAGANPMNYKKALAHKLTEMLNDIQAADEAKVFFESTFQKRETPTDIPIVTVSPHSTPIIDLLTQANLVKSRSEAKTLITSGAVEVDGTTVKDIGYTIEPKSDMVVRVGKHRFIKLQIKN